MCETWLREPSTGTEQIIARNRILMESKPEAQKNTDLLNIERRYSWIQWEQQDSATLPLTLRKSLLQMCKMGTDCKQAWETKLRHIIAILCCN